MGEADTGVNATSHPLDDPVRSALTGPHAHLAEVRGRVMRYPPDVLKFVAIPYPATADDWAEAAAWAGPEQVGVGVVVAPPADWLLSSVGQGLQLVEDRVRPRFDAEAVRLGPADVPEIVEFVARHRNGRRFPPRTLETGTYLGFRRGGALVAMAGERLRPAGWSELSAVCTDPAYRRQGLATRLVLALVAGIHERGDAVFLHVEGDNVEAIALYERLGFRLRRPISMARVHIPPNP
ncbi:GNAT family N-acetyltransferase [Hamadaea tsunoensis]|uniref:GNAT family N-acetyltransferase n=1 Tax=Hamadaea tsunoensis TaxID=53368 RepID=UPI0006843748|nr:GNAT family N-acetyltransferase [Hamadaea tsunoensis]